MRNQKLADLFLLCVISPAMQKTAAALYQGCLDNSLAVVSWSLLSSQFALSTLHQGLSSNLPDEDGKEVVVALAGGALVGLNQPRLQPQPRTGTTCRSRWTDGR